MITTTVIKKYNDRIPPNHPLYLTPELIDEKQCGHEPFNHNGPCCTREKGHDSNLHAGHGMNLDMLYTWTQEIE